MVEATNPHRLFPTSMSYVYTVFQHHDMLWMGICVYPYTVTSRPGVEFRKIELSPSPSDVVMSWLRLQTRLECIPHPCHMYTKCFSTLICRGWAYGCTLTLLRLCRAGVDFRKIELSPSPSDVVMSWLRLQTCLECIPHPCHMSTKCLSTLICCGWAYGCALTLLPILLGSYFVVLCHLWSQHDVIMSWLRLTDTSNWFPHPYYTYTKCLSTLICCPLAYSSSLTQYYEH